MHPLDTSTSTSWRQRGLKRVPRSNLDHLILPAFLSIVLIVNISITSFFLSDFTTTIHKEKQEASRIRYETDINSSPLLYTNLVGHETKEYINHLKMIGHSMKRAH